MREDVCDFPPERWARLAESLELDPSHGVVVALSGGADSIYLLHLLLAAEPRPRILAVHVDHGLRGLESDADASFCAAECARLGVEFELRRAELDPTTTGLEARARAARYAELGAAARAARIATILTAHHADDALETLLLRWLRGAEIAGLPALREKLAAEVPLVPRPMRAERRESLRAAGTALVVARPLLGVRRSEIRAALARRGIAWREDSSNRDTRFARNAVRNELLPAIADACGPGALDNLHAFGRAVRGLEASLAEKSRLLRVAPPLFAAARRSAKTARLGGRIARAEIAALERPLARRALARMLAEETGAVPRRAALDALVEDVFAGRTGWREVRGGWRLQLRADRIDLEPPPVRVERTDARQLALPFEDGRGERALSVPGRLDLGEGRGLVATRVEREAGADCSRDPQRVEIDAAGLPPDLVVRLPRRGDRFHPLGAAGSKPLSRFLADAGVPRHDRARIPLVLADDRILWVVGIRPGEACRVRPTTTERFELTLSLEELADSSRAR